MLPILKIILNFAVVKDTLQALFNKIEIVKRKYQNSKFQRIC